MQQIFDEAGLKLLVTTVDRKLSSKKFEIILLRINLLIGRAMGVEAQNDFGGTKVLPEK